MQLQSLKKIVPNWLITGIKNEMDNDITNSTIISLFGKCIGVE